MLLMQEMSKAPNVSKNVVNMTNALAKLSSQGSKVKSAAYEQLIKDMQFRVSIAEKELRDTVLSLIGKKEFV